MKRLSLVLFLILLGVSGELRAQCRIPNCDYGSASQPLINHLNIWNTCLQQSKPEVVKVKQAETKAAPINVTITSVAIAPNPAKNFSTLSVTLASRSPLNYRIYDVSGRIIQSLELRDQAIGTHEWLINTARLRSGAYVITISDGTIQRSLHLNVVR